MKEKIFRVAKIVFLALTIYVLIYCEEEIYSPWNVITTHQYEGHLYCCYFIDTNDGWAAGDFSAVIFRYYNSKWHNFPLPDLPEGYKNYGFYDIYFNSENDGWIVGRGLLEGVGIRGVIIHWNGEKWEDRTPQPYSDFHSLTCVFFTSPDEGWAGSQHGDIYHYTNGQWSNYGALEMSIDSLWFNSPTDGWACGHPTTLYHWDGYEWTCKYSLPLANSVFKSVVFTSPEDGWLLEQIIGEGGGVCRVFLYDPQKKMFDFNRYYVFGMNELINSISFSNPDDGWAVGGEWSYHWDGNTWTEVPVPYLEYVGLNDVFAISPDDVWAVGDWGTILHFTGWK
ncbi:MAG: WD40/YVTN/BNR-like repeat-containing protein [bacterium]